MEIESCESSKANDKAGNEEIKSEVSSTEEKNGKNEASSDENEKPKSETSNDVSEANSENASTKSVDDSVDASSKFKKPVLLIGPKRGKVKKLRSVSDVKETEQTQAVQNTENNANDTVAATAAIKESDPAPVQTAPAPQKDIPLSYTEPPWGGIPEKEYKMEILKSGVILDTIDLSKKSFHVVGRLPTCDIPLAHPTISRYHAILQYRVTGNEKNPAGLYLYDLGSINGTFWNGNRVRPNLYVRIQGGHMIRFGCSQRRFIVLAPPEDQEEESEFTVTELKQKRMLALQEREKERLLREEEIRLEKEKEENAGIDWGMGEDADEETDLSENPYASTGNEELFLNDPKKTLRGWFEREGYELQYQTEEKGIGQFLCWVNLPVESVTGHAVRAEAVVKGKKKESVVQCALEACRILDRLGLLRQANHEARKKKAKNWEEEDYYDSDEDNFLDRTGAIEKKREQRMRLAGKLETKVETYSSLLEKHAEVVKQISRIEKSLEDARQATEANADNSDEDALDAFMSTLNKPVLNKNDMRKMKLELQNLRKEETKLKELVDLAKPANLPPLTTNPLVQQSNERTSENTIISTRQKSIISNIGQRRKLQTTNKNEKNLFKQTTLPVPNNINDTNEEEEEEDESEEETTNETSDVKKDDCDNLQRMETDANDNDKMKSTLGTNETVIDKNEQETEKSDAGSEKDASKSSKNGKDNRSENKRSLENATSKKEAKKVKRKDTEKSSDLDMYRDDYSTWLPPQGQTGDGKTSLNEKFGY